MEGSLRPEPRRWRMSHGWTFLSCRLSDETVPVPGCPRLSSFLLSPRSDDSKQVCLGADPATDSTGQATCQKHEPPPPPRLKTQCGSARMRELRRPVCAPALAPLALQILNVVGGTMEEVVRFRKRTASKTVSNAGCWLNQSGHRTTADRLKTFRPPTNMPSVWAAPPPTPDCCAQSQHWFI